MKAEVFDSCPFEQVFETSLHPLSPGSGVCFWWKNPVIVMVGDEDNIVLGRSGHKAPQLFSKFWKHWGITHLPALQLSPHRQQSLVVHHVRPSQAEDF